MIYLAIFSNLFSSYILALYAGIHIVRCFAAHRRDKGLLRDIRENAVYFIIIFMFLLSMVLEANGTRAENIENSFSIEQTIGVLIYRLWHIKKMFLLISAALIAFLGIYILLCKKDHPEEASFARCIRVMGLCGVYGVMSLTWVILLCTASNPEYIQQMDVLLGPMFFLIFCVTNAAAFLMERFPRIVVAVPLALYIGASTIWSIEGRSFRGEANPYGWIALENHHIQQFIDADQAGEQAVKLELTDIYEERWMGERIARALYKHGITKRQLEVEPVYNPELKEEFQISTPVWLDMR